MVIKRTEWRSQSFYNFQSVKCKNSNMAIFPLYFGAEPFVNKKNPHKSPIWAEFGPLQLPLFKYYSEKSDYFQVNVRALVFTLLREKHRTFL